MHNDATPDVGSGPADNSGNVVGYGVRKVNVSPTLEKLLAYFTAIGVDRDVHASTIIELLGLEEIRAGRHVGPYTGRFNYYEQRKRSPFRLVVGDAPNCYRLVKLRTVALS